MSKPDAVFEKQRTKMEELYEEKEDYKRRYEDVDHQVVYLKEQLNDLQDRFDKYRAAHSD